MEALIIAAITGFISTLCTVTALKNDMSWVKKQLSSHDTRLTKLEEQKP